jgi:uncharacterized protein (TIGR02996 family)
MNRRQHLKTNPPGQRMSPAVAFSTPLPDAEPPRIAPLVLADWLEQSGSPTQAAQGEFLRLQIQRAWIDDQPEPLPEPLARRRSAFRRREDQLQRAYQAEWLTDGLATSVLPRHVRFERGDVEYLDFSGTRLTDDDLAALAVLPRLRRLTLADTAVSDAGCASLARLPSLERLDLRRTAVTDRGLARLASAPRLVALVVEGASVTPAGADAAKLRQVDRLLQLAPSARREAALAALAILVDESPVDHLGRLDLRECAATDADLAYVRSVPEITELYLNDLPITSAGLERLAGAPHLTLLDVSDTGLADLTPLASLPALVELRAENLPLGEHSVSQLAPLRHLRRLVVTGSVWPEHVESLTTALPDTEIVCEPKRFWV